MVRVYLLGMARHSLGQAEDVGASRSQEAVPEPEVRHQFRIRPGETANVVAPCMAGGIIGVHDIPEVPEVIPAPLLDLPLVERDRVIQLLLDPLLSGVGTVRQTPDAKG